MARARREEGSLLVEALVGIGLLGLIVAAVATLLPAALEADARARAHRTATVVGDVLLEAGVAGLPGTAVPLDGTIEGVRIMSVGPADLNGDAPGLQPAWIGSGCGRALHDDARVIEVGVEHGARTDGRTVVLRSGERSAVAASEPRNDLVVRMPGAGGIEDLVLVDPEGGISSAEPLGEACAVFRDLPSGTSWISASEGSTLLVDGLHVPLQQRPLPVTLAGHPHSRALDVAPAGWLRVDVDDHGARRPDHVSSGALRWFLRGDDADLGVALGQSRPVRPGLATVVVPPCRGGATTASSVTALVRAGEETSIDIPLAVVTIENVRDRDEAWLVMQRDTDCADGTRVRPSIIFSGDLHEGMRVALPRGRWDAWLEWPDSDGLTGSVRFSAAGTDAVVRLP